MKTRKFLAGMLAVVLTLCMVLPAMANESDAPEFPTATVTEVAEPQQDVPIYDTSYNQTGETVDVDAEYVFKAVEPTPEQVAYYGGWYCDYRVSFDDTLEAESFGLYGAYNGPYGDLKVAFKYPADAGAEPVYLLASLGLDSQLTYSEILDNVDPFNCGVFNYSEDNAGKTMTVELVMWNPDDETGDVHVVGTTSYTFPSTIPPFPTATVTEVAEPPAEAPLYDVIERTATGETVAVDAAYVFTADEVTRKQVKYYGDWICDYRVSFDDTLEAESFGLYGAYNGAYGDLEAAFKFPIDAGAEQVYLLESTGLDAHLTFNEVLNNVGAFTCGVFNLSEDNAGKTMTVELVMWAPDSNHDDAHVVDTTRYTFPSNTPPLPTATVTELDPLTYKDVYDYNDVFGDPVAVVESIDAVYLFEADDPSPATEAYYRPWDCDYEVSFSDDLAAESFGLYGSYSGFGNDYDVAFLFPTSTGTEPIRLLATAGFGRVNYADLLDQVQSFTCGVFNLSEDNIGQTMTVKLVITNPDDPNESYVISEKEYTFDSITNLVESATCTVTLTSQDLKGNTGIATLTGGGSFTVGEEVTVNAPIVEGYTFIGWYKDGYVPSNFVSTDSSYTFYAEGDVDLVAVYEGQTVKGMLHVIGSTYKVNDGELQTSRNDFDIEIGASTVLSYTGEDFLYWVNISGNIVSTSPTYTFTMVGETTLRLITSRNAGSDASVYVVFKNAFSQVITEGRVIDAEGAEELFPKSHPSKMTLEFEKWVFEDTGEEATPDSIAARIDASSPVVTVIPQYVGSEDTFTLIIKAKDASGETEVEGLSGEEILAASSKSVNLSDIVDATGLAEEEFSYWTLDDLGIISYDPVQCTVIGEPGATVTLTAVFEGEVEPEPVVSVIQLYSSMNGEKYRVSSILHYYMPEGYTVHKSGFVRSTSEGTFTEDDLVIGAPNTKLHVTAFTTQSAIYNLGINTSNANKVFYFRAFVTCEYNGEIVTFYSPMVYGSYSSLQ